MLEASPRPAGSDLDSGSPASATSVGLLLGAVLAPAALGISTTAIALSALSADLHLSRATAAWVLAGFLVTQAMLVPVFGRLSDLYGIRFAFLSGIALIIVGSVFAGLSNSFAVVLVGRLIQGAGAAAFWVSCQGVIGARFGAVDRAAGLGAMVAVIGLVSGSGTLIGGALTDAVSWRLVIALPALAVVPAVACMRLAPRAPAARRGRLDLIGAALVAASSAMILLLLEAPSMHPGAPLTLAFLVAGVAAILGAWRHTKRVRDGFLPAPVIEQHNFALASLAGLSVMAAYVAVLFAVPILLTLHHHWSATHVGLVLVPAATVGGWSAFFFSRLRARWDPFRVTAVLAGASALGLLAVGVADGSPILTVIGLGLVLAGLTGANVLLVSRVPLMVDPAARNVALGIFTLIFQIGGALGTAAVAGLEDPLGLAGAVSLLALVPALGILAALRAGVLAGRQPSASTSNVRAEALPGLR
jgi:MFS family permease